MNTFITQIAKAECPESVVLLLNTYAELNNLTQLPPNRNEWKKVYKSPEYMWFSTDEVAKTARRKISDLCHDDSDNLLKPQTVELSTHEIDLIWRAGEYTSMKLMNTLISSVHSYYDEDAGVFVNDHGDSSAIKRVANFSAISTIDTVMPLLRRIHNIIYKQTDGLINWDAPHEEHERLELQMFPVHLTGRDVKLLKTFSGAISQWIFVYFEADIAEAITDATNDAEFYGDDADMERHKRQIAEGVKTRRGLDRKIYKKLCDKLMDL